MTYLDIIATLFFLLCAFLIFPTLASIAKSLQEIARVNTTYVKKEEIKDHPMYVLETDEERKERELRSWQQ